LDFIADPNAHTDSESDTQPAPSLVAQNEYTHAPGNAISFHALNRWTVLANFDIRLSPSSRVL
jgi:hypothetical protein